MQGLPDVRRALGETAFSPNSESMFTISNGVIQDEYAQSSLHYLRS